MLRTVRLLIVIYSIMISIINTTTAQATEEDSSQPESSVNDNSCPVGCASCSLWNGCIQCEADFIWHIQPIYMRRVGVCLKQCPKGHMTHRAEDQPDNSRCVACENAHCNRCDFTPAFCDECRQPHIEFRGTCVLECPDGLTHSKYRKDCFEQIDCLAGSWSGWSVCKREGLTCGYKWGNQSRTRQVLEHPSSNGQECSELFETKRCRLAERYCLANNNPQDKDSFPPNDQRKSRHKKREKARRKCRMRRRMGLPCKQRIKSSSNNIKADHHSETSRLNLTTSDKNYYDYYRKRSEDLFKLIQEQSLANS